MPRLTWREGLGPDVEGGARGCSLNKLLPVLEAVLQDSRPLLIIAEDVDGEALATLLVNRMRAGIKVCAVKAPGFGETRKGNLRDIAVLTGATVRFRLCPACTACTCPVPPPCPAPGSVPPLLRLCSVTPVSKIRDRKGGSGSTKGGSAFFDAILGLGSSHVAGGWVVGEVEAGSEVNGVGGQKSLGRG